MTTAAMDTTTLFTITADIARTDARLKRRDNGLDRRRMLPRGDYAKVFPET